MSDILFNWIQESSSWKSAVELKVLERQSNETNFLKRSDDFYISLFNRMYKSLREKKYESEEGKLEILSVAKGLEIYSSETTRLQFLGVNYAENMLYTASIYYLTGYFTTAFILAKLFEKSDFDTEIDKFIHAFLCSDKNIDNKYINILNTYLITGQEQELLNLFKEIEKNMEIAEPLQYAPLLVAKNLIEKFMEENIWKSLTNANSLIDWTPFIIEKINQSWVFLPSQDAAIKEGILTNNQTYSLQMPTSSGKTSLCELIIYNEVKNLKRKVILLAPFRALAAELNIVFTKKFNNLDINIKTMYGGHLPTYEEKINLENVDLLICTPEKFMAIENHFPNLHDNFDTVICDEGHLLDDEQRGLNYELLLSKLRNNKEGVVEKRFIFLSAIIPNIKDINNWLGGNEETLISSDYRPSDLSFGYLIDKKEAFNLRVHSSSNRFIDYEIKNILSIQKDYKYIKSSTRKVNTYHYKTFKAKSVSLALRSIPTGSVALFTPHKGKNGTNGMAEEVINQLNLLKFESPYYYSNEHEIIDIVLYFGQVFGESSIYTKSVENGFVIHHGDIPQFVREIIENAVRNKIVPLVICTNTLAEGVNLPIKTMVVHTIKRFDSNLGKNVNMLKRNIKNIIGRAGRAGKEKEGLVIFVNPSEYKYIEEVVSEDNIEPVRGHLYNIIKNITRILINDRIFLTNNLIDMQNEEFKRLIDSIDKSIIDSLYEEISVDELHGKIQMLINRTFSYFQASEIEKKTIIDIYHLRSSLLVPYIQNNRIKVLKESNTNIRLYEDIISKVSISDDFWIVNCLPESRENIRYFLTVLLSLNYIILDLLKFQDNNKISLEIEELETIILMWIEGYWYSEIAEALNKDMEEVLKIFTLINSSFCPMINNIIYIVKSELEIEGKELNKSIESWSLHLQYGLNLPISLKLIELGFIERISNRALSKLILLNFSEAAVYSHELIKRVILKNKQAIIESMEKEVIGIPFKEFQKNINKIQYL